MSRLTHAQQLAYAHEMNEIYENHGAEITRAGVDADARRREGERLHAIAADKSANQETVAAMHLEATRNADETREASFKYARANAELAINALGSDAGISRRLRNMLDAMTNEAARTGRAEARTDTPPAEPAPDA